MKRRPWPLMLLALLHVLAPVGNLLINSWLTHMAPLTYLQAMLTSYDWLSFFQFFIALPLAGYAIYRCNQWSLPIFFGSMFLGLFYEFRSRAEFPQTFPFWLFVASTAIDVIIVGYFLIPPIRAFFFDRRLRWWENKPRYRVHLWARLKTEQGPKKALIRDLSEGGVFLKTREELKTGSEIQLVFSFLHERIRVSGKVTYRSRSIHPGYGIQFLHTPETQIQLKRLTAALQVFGARVPGQISMQEDFMRWVSLLPKREGWIPQMTPLHRTDSSSAIK